MLDARSRSGGMVGSGTTDNSFLDRFDQEYAQKLGRRKEGFRVIFERLEALPKRRFSLLETGSTRTIGNWEGDGQSTILFDAFLNFHEGLLFSIDLNPEATVTSRKHTSPKTHCICSDSVRFINDLSRLMRSTLEFDLFYLDSFDVDFNNPMPSAFHHVKELMSVGKLAEGTIIAIDDNVEREGKLIGKGGLVEEYFSEIGVAPIYRGYQFVWQV
jgi:hypothetical protein